MRQTVNHIIETYKRDGHPRTHPAYIRGVRAGMAGNPRKIYRSATVQQAFCQGYHIGRLALNHPEFTP